MASLQALRVRRLPRPEFQARQLAANLRGPGPCALSCRANNNKHYLPYNTEITMKRSLLLTLLAPVVAASSLHAASDMFLKIDGVKGESSDERHKDQIEILSFSWGSTNSAIGSGSSGGGE